MLIVGIISSSTGFVHLVFSLLALVFGSIVLAKTKATLFHKQMGYCYALSMLGVIITSFLLYNLFGRFGMFHYMAIVSSLTLLAGMIPIILRKPTGYISLHFNFMYWSVIGLYGAFVAELFVRIPPLVIESGKPNGAFFAMVGLAIFSVMGLGAYYAVRNKKKWERFDKNLTIRD